MRDSYHYLDSVVFKVENILFKVPRWQFERHSGVFATTFSLPQPGEGGVEGSTDEHPLLLNGIKAKDFKALLGILYPLSIIPKIPILSSQGWISVLKLATLWDFIEVRDLAIGKLEEYAESLDEIARIQLGRDYDVSTWIRSGYTELAQRKSPISSEEAAKIGFEVALQICQLRETAIAPPQSSHNPFAIVALGTKFDAEFRRADTAHEPSLCPPSISPADADSPLGLAGANFETTRSNYERARAFMDYYCRRFSYGEPDVAFTENSSGQWQAMMDVGGRRIGLGTSNNKHNAQVQCYLDVTAYLTSCDPELWKAYITESATGSAHGGDSG